MDHKEGDTSGNFEDQPPMTEVDAIAAPPPIAVAADWPESIPIGPEAELVEIYKVRTDIPFPGRIAKPGRRRWTSVNSIKIENFKAIDDALIPLAHVTLLVGPNGSGKSSALQAIHWAARAASYILPKNGKEMMAFERIDYLPSSEPLKMAHRGELRTETNTRPTRVTFNHAPNAEEEDQSPAAVVSIWAARNKGGISAHIEGGNAVSPFKQRDNFLTAYIPGLAGLSEKETILAQPLLRRQAASGDAGGVLRNVLLNLSSRLTGEANDDAAKQRIARLNELASRVHPGISVEVTFDEREDFNINAVYHDHNIGAEGRSLETAATGVLQVIQIFAYLVLFRPKIMLIDEPDAHLHPDKQERLIEALERAAVEFDAQIILTTHSPHVIRGASSSAQFVWMSEGSVKTGDDDAIRRLMGWGALDKDALFFVEDEEDRPIRAILQQWPALFRRLSICRCFGIENLPKDRLLSALLVDGKIEMKAIVHRDRDFMTDDECKKWMSLYNTNGVNTWVTAGVDAEFYFCDPKYLSSLFSIEIETANAWVMKAAETITGAKDKFFEKRKNINSALHRDGGSPISDTLWNDRGGKGPGTVLGKKLFKALKPIVKMAGYSDELLDSWTIPTNYEMAPDLREVLEAALSKTNT